MTSFLIILIKYNTIGTKYCEIEMEITKKDTINP